MQSTSSTARIAASKRPSPTTPASNTSTTTSGSFWKSGSVDDEGATTAVNQYVWSPRYIDAPVARFHDGNGDGDLLDAGDNIRYYTGDANHNVTATIDAATGDVVNRYVYSAYGEVTVYTRRGRIRPPPPNDGPLYCGYFFDAETGNYQVRNREYVTCLSTFDMTDPVGYKGGINLYAYVGDSPLMLTDPTGLLGRGYLVCVRSEGSHSWIYAKNLDDGTEHTYGRWNAGYGGCNSKGVHMDVELKAGRKHTCERCIIVSTFTPTFNFGYDWYNKNCSTYAHDLGKN